MGGRLFKIFVYVRLGMKNLLQRNLKILRNAEGLIDYLN